MAKSSPLPAPKRPKPRQCGDLRLNVVRGPDEAGRWYWRARRFRDNASETVWCGWGTTDEADRAVAELVSKGSVARHHQDDTADTIRDLCELYVARQRRRADITTESVDTLKIMLKRVSAGIGDVKVDRIDSATLERHRDTRLRAGGAPASIRAELVRLRAAWTWGQEMGLVPMRALPRVRVTAEPRNCRTTPTRGDLIAVLAQLQGWQRLAVLLFAATGARLGELADLRWQDVALDRAELTVTGKTGTRVVPIAAPVVASLELWRAEHPRHAEGDRIWGVGGSSVRAKMRLILAKACERAKVPRFTAQGLRRAAVDALYRAGVDPAAAAAVVGHSPAVALAAYRRATEADRRRAVRAARLGYLDDTQVLSIDRREGQP